jgi:hypothetical protein
MSEIERPSDRVIREAIAGLRPGKSRKPVIRKLKPRDQLDAESAARHNARNAAKWSLWAAAGKLDDVTPIISGDHVAQRREEATDHHREHAERQRRKAEAMRRAVVDLVTPEQLARLDERRANCPKGHEYAASLWNNELARLTGRTPLEVFNEWKDRESYYSDMVRPDHSAEVDAAIRAGLVEIASKL